MTTLLSLAAITIALQAAALGPLHDRFWGFHLYAFLPTALAPASWLLLLASAVLLLRPRSLSLQPRFLSTRVNSIANIIWRRPVPCALGLALLLSSLFWILRSEQLLLGDALPLTIDLPNGNAFHPRQPLAMGLQHVLYEFGGDFFRGTGVGDETVARRAVAFGSVAAGFLFVLVAFAAGRVLASLASQRKGETPDRLPLAHRTQVALLATLLILTQGYALLFFGYVENYAYYALSVAAYLLGGLLFLQGRLSLGFVALIFVIGLGVHLSTLGLLPSLLALIAWGLWRREHRRDAVIGLLVAAVSAIALSTMLGRMSPGFTLWGGLRQIINVANEAHGAGSGAAYLFSAVHLRDFINEQALIGPLAAFLFLPALANAIVRKTLWQPVPVFLVFAAGGYLLGSWMMSEPTLGYARDWDLFAPAGVCYTFAALYFLLRSVSNAAPRILLFAVIFSILHIVPWVWINHSEALSLQRMKTLPLGLGRTEVVVGNWYLEHGEHEAAGRWFRRALETNPRNAVAHSFVGQLAAQQGRYDIACEAYQQATTFRPDKPGYRNNYVLALHELGRYEESIPHLKWLIDYAPERVGYWRLLGTTLTQLGRARELREVHTRLLRFAEHAIAIQPPNEIAYVEAGTLLALLDRDAEAVARFREALEINPTSLGALFNAGSILVRMGRNEEARPLLSRFIELYPDRPQADWARQQIGR